MKIFPKNKTEVSFNEFDFSKRFKQYDFGHKKERLYIHWDITSKCNFNCSYCYAKRDYQPKNEWGKLDSWNRQKLVLKSLDLAELPIFLGILGGEPTLHPNFFNLIDECNKIIQKNKNSRLYITTNGSTNVYKDMVYKPNNYFLWSIHLEHEKNYGENFKKVFDNIKICIDKGFKNRVNFLMLPDEKYFPKIHFIFNELSKLNVEIHPHFLYFDPCEKTSLFNYSEKFYEEFKYMKELEGYFTFENDTQFVKLNDFQIFHNKLNSFTGWDCYNNNYEINWNGDVVNLCKRQKESLITNPWFFKNIKKIEPFKCPYKECNCDGLLKVLKVKN